MELPTVEEVAERLPPLNPQGGMRPSPAWRDIMDMFQHTSSIGEVRTAEDWSRLPAERPVRVVYLIDDQGPVLRWSDEATPILASVLFHHDLERGDGLGRARSGYVRRRADGAIEVYP